MCILPVCLWKPQIRIYSTRLYKQFQSSEQTMECRPTTIRLRRSRRRGFDKVGGVTTSIHHVYPSYFPFLVVAVALSASRPLGFSARKPFRMLWETVEPTTNVRGHHRRTYSMYVSEPRRQRCPAGGHPATRPARSVATKGISARRASPPSMCGVVSTTRHLNARSHSTDLRRCMQRRDQSSAIHLHYPREIRITDA